MGAHQVFDWVGDGGIGAARGLDGKAAGEFQQRGLIGIHDECSFIYLGWWSSRSRESGKAEHSTGLMIKFARLEIETRILVVSRPSSFGANGGWLLSQPLGADAPPTGEAGSLSKLVAAILLWEGLQPREPATGRPRQALLQLSDSRGDAPKITGRATRMRRAHPTRELLCIKQRVLSTGSESRLSR